jgi:hypothetical protein
MNRPYAMAPRTGTSKRSRAPKHSGASFEQRRQSIRIFTLCGDDDAVGEEDEPETACFRRNGYGCLYRLNIPDNCIEAIVARYEVSKAEHIKERDIACYPLHNLLANDTESTSSPSSRPAR